ncbi:MAG TPA: winged helix DNA-binding domain-containing protein [Gaiellaceae bacterium]|nr:winged helix DNA-binding domain-containing protein [Gaiellaceae bacterium]
MSERTLTRRDLNRALLARQLLLDRKPLPIPRAVEQIGALQTQYAPSAYVGLWTRVDGFERQALTEAFERRAVVQGTMMRNTIHVASPRDYWPLVLAIRPERMAWSRRIQKTESRELERAARRLRAFLSGCPRSQAEIVEKLGDEVWRPGIAIWLDLVRVPPSGTWERRRADLFGLAEEWVGPEPELAHEQAVRHLVRRYLGAFGPAPRIAIADWAGMRVGRLERTLERMRLRRFRDERGRELLDLPRGALPDPETPAPPRFLPVWDATLLVHARRTGILPEEHRPRIFNTRTPHSFNTFLVDGAVAGTWRYDKRRIALEPFERIPREARKELDEEAERLAAFHA